MSRPGFLWRVLLQVSLGKTAEYNEKNFRKKNIVYFQTDKLVIRNTGSAPLHIDGDPSDTAKNFSIEIIPDAFKLIQPK